jgi:hypothetical protein
MSGSQLPLFQRKTYRGIIPAIPVEIQAPGADKTVLETLPAYYTYLTSGGFSKYTPDDFTGDLKKFGVYCKEKKSRKLKLPIDIIPVFNDYVGAYKVDDVLFPYTPHFVRYLICDTAQKAGVKKKVSAQILRDTGAIRQLRRGEGMERVLMRLGLSETTWEDAKIKYQRLSAGGL